MNKTLHVACALATSWLVALLTAYLISEQEDHDSSDDVGAKSCSCNKKCIGQLQITWTASPFFDMIAALRVLSALLLLYCVAVYK